MGLISDFVAGRMPPALYEEYLTPGFFTPWTESLLDQSPPRGRVLDVASGTGAVSRAIARHGSELTVAAIDVAPPMIQFAETETDTAGLSDRISFTLASADALPFENQSFDSAYCQQGLQFFPDKVAALKEMKRVLRPGSQIAVSVWTSAANGNPAFAALEDIIADRISPDQVPFGPFAYGDKAAIGQNAEAAGLTIVSLDQQTRMTRLPAPHTVLLFDLLFLGRPAADGALQPIFDPSDESKDPLIAELIAAFETATAEFTQPDGTMLCPSTANVLIAQA
ncbi:MAG: class I SAM-dependent methyltransferase [Pseudomonadota bacterium]